jgi:hypothetical protein
MISPDLRPDLQLLQLPDGSHELHVIVKLPAKTEISNARSFEKQAQQAVAAIGSAMMEYGLSAFDAAGEPLRVGTAWFHSKGLHTETYQSSFGPITLPRHLYQGPEGGESYVPLEDRARIIGLSTPLFASSIAAKYAESNGRAVQQDLEEHHARKVSLSLIQRLSAEVARIALTKEEYWPYTPTSDPARVSHIALGIDGTCSHLCDVGWKQVMVGTLTLYDAEGQELEILYFANAPEDGKKEFFTRLEREVQTLRRCYPEALWVGISDGAKDLRPELEKYCSQLILDFYHATEYVAAAAPAMFATSRGEQARRTWLTGALHRLKHEEGAAQTLLDEMSERLQAARRLGEADRNALQKAVGYFENNVDRMDYAAAQREHLPIGSGITEAACKTIVKARICGGGMRWHGQSMQEVLCLRALRRSSNRWAQFWSQIDRVGY